MSYNLIPFGLCAISGELMDVAEVQRGKKCNCVCPSCATPLVARQADVNEWHFAHDSKKVYEQTKKECDYSFFVSVRMMARQVIGQEFTLKLPSYSDTLTQVCTNTGRVSSLEFKVTNECEIKLKDIKTESNYQGVAVDFVSNIGRYQLVIYITHQGRGVPAELLENINDNCGLIELSLNDIGQLFASARQRKENFKSLLLCYLSDNLSSKTWLKHPRYQMSLIAAKQELSTLQTIEMTEAEHIISPYHSLKSNYKDEQQTILQHTESAKVTFECLNCNLAWKGYERGLNNCPNCETHLYRRIALTPINKR